MQSRLSVRGMSARVRDFDVEYPPAALGVFEAMGSRTYDGFRRHLFALQVACQALIVFLLFRFWSRRAGWSYLLLSAPMLFVVYNGYDLVGVALVGVVTSIWWAAWQRPHVPEGVAETAAIAAVLVFGTLLSPQFLVWLLPFAAIAAAGGARRIEHWALGVSVLTLLDRIVFDPGSPGLLRTELVVLGRNAVLAGLLVVAVGELRAVVSSREPVPVPA